MRTTRLTGSALGILAAVAFAASGCAEDGGVATAPSASATAGPTASASTGAADPAAAAALGDAAAALGTTSFTITMTSGPSFKLTGQVDAPNGNGTADLSVSGPNAELRVQTLLVGQDLYLKVPGITKAGTWTHVDVARLPEGADVGLRPGRIDPADTANLLTSTTDVQRVGSGSYRGTLDLTKAAGLTGVDQVTIDGYGAAAQHVPFTAGLDEQGRLSTLTVQLPAADGGQAQPLDIRYTDYGAPVDAQRPPASQVTEAPDSLYTSLGG